MKWQGYKNKEKADQTESDDKEVQDLLWKHIGNIKDSCESMKEIKDSKTPLRLLEEMVVLGDGCDCCWMVFKDEPADMF